MKLKKLVIWYTYFPFAHLLNNFSDVPDFAWESAEEQISGVIVGKAYNFCS